LPKADGQPKREVEEYNWYLNRICRR
jgi:hypothetical protein